LRLQRGVSSGLGHDPFYVELRELRTGTEMYKIPLQPELGKGDVIKLNIYHVPPEDLPLEKTVEDTPADDSPAPHFAAYYGLFTPPLSLPVPLFRTVDACTPYGGTGCTKLQDAGGAESMIKTVRLRGYLFAVE